MTYISFSFHPDENARFSHVNEEGIHQPTLTQESGKPIPVQDQDGNEIGTGYVTSIGTFDNEITVVMRVDIERPFRIWDLAGFSVGPDQASEPDRAIAAVLDEIDAVLKYFTPDIKGRAVDCHLDSRPPGRKTCTKVRFRVPFDPETPRLTMVDYMDSIAGHVVEHHPELLSELPEPPAKEETDA